MIADRELVPAKHVLPFVLVTALFFLWGIPNNLNDGGAVNALAGGGTLITFPMLTAVGVPTVAANVTNTVALCPGYRGAEQGNGG
ncbi:MAG: hypothetical protein LAQ30_19255 [Acidobacteriia bacterium]|nr:hypothetical protein [Terriglobia bacterium]